MEDAKKYQMAVAVFDMLRAIIPLFAANKAFMRATEPITLAIRNEMPTTSGIPGSNRDRAVCALVNKACNTHAAVRILTDAGHGDDAMALGRVLLENTVILKWLLIDAIYRLDLYCISDALYRRRWCQLVQEHFQEKPALVKQAHDSLDAEVAAVAAFFGNTIHKWAQVLHPDGDLHHVNFEAMMKEVAQHGGASSTFMHDVIYFLHSAYVHSTASSMRSFRHLRNETYFRFDLGPNSLRCDEALGGANLCLLQVLQVAAAYLGFSDIDAELDKVFAHIRTSFEGSPDVDAGSASAGA